jgi:hypothetical protein
MLSQDQIGLFNALLCKFMHFINCLVTLLFTLIHVQKGWHRTTTNLGKCGKRYSKHMTISALLLTHKLN